MFVYKAECENSFTYVVGLSDASMEFIINYSTLFIFTHLSNAFIQENSNFGIM